MNTHIMWLIKQLQIASLTMKLTLPIALLLTQEDSGIMPDTIQGEVQHLTT